MNKSSVVVIGLPESGKTTFLAALWYVISAREMDSALRFHSLSAGIDITHLNKIAARWCEAKVQDRTAHGGIKMVQMNLLDKQGNAVEVTFPDVPGEKYRQMWEERECEPNVAELLRASNVLLFVHADKMKFPHWVTDRAALLEYFGTMPKTEEEVIPWQPSFAPTQVQLVEMLQLLQLPPLDVGPRRLAVILSAWDKAEPSGIMPEKYLQQKLPLFAQYLQQNSDKWTCSVFGLSAQGGDYDPFEANKPRVPEAENMRRMPNPADRIKVRSEEGFNHDITTPLAWLMKQ